MTLAPKTGLGRSGLTSGSAGLGGGSLAAGGSAPASLTLIYDSFTEAVETIITSHTPDTVVAPAATPWVQETPAAKVNTTGSIVTGTGGAGLQACWINGGISDGIIACSNLRPTGTNFVLVFRLLNRSNFWGVRNNSNNLDLIEYVAGGFNLRASFNTGVTGIRAKVAVIANGSSISVYLDGVLVISHTSTAKQTETNHGFFSFGASLTPDQPIADDFWVINSTDAADLP